MKNYNLSSFYFYLYCCSALNQTQRNQIVSQGRLLNLSMCIVCAVFNIFFYYNSINTLHFMNTFIIILCYWLNYIH